jgi:peroxiredoxin
MNKSFNMIIWVIALVTLLIAAYTFYAENKVKSINPPLRQDTSQAEKIMVPDFTLNDLDGKSVKLSDYRGKIVILNFWAVWCKYCKLEMPDLNELNKELEKGNDAVILAVDVQESPDKVRNYLTSNNIGLKVLLDEEGAVAEAYGITGYPTTLVINKDGSLYTHISGAADKETLRNAIDKAKKGEPVQ